MTEAEWLASADPIRMLRALDHRNARVAPKDSPLWEYKLSDRKLRLFAAACYRDVVEDAKGIADACGAADEAEFWAEHGHAAPGVRESSSPRDINDRAMDHATGAASWAHYHRGVRTPEQLNATQAAFLRDIIGNPWRSVTLPVCSRCDGDGEAHGSDRPGVWSGPGTYPGPCPKCKGLKSDSPWLTHADGRVPKMAQVIYDERRWSDMPMLADALEESGCRDDVVLRWCRGEERCPICMGHGYVISKYGSPGVTCSMCGGEADGWIPRRCQSVRGDWMIDLLLGKE